MHARNAPRLTSTLIALVLAAPTAIAQEVSKADAAAMIANALSAGPEAITATATVTDLQGNVLREGTGKYTCMPDDPEVPGNGPFCLDAVWGRWLGAWLNREDPPAVEELAFIYALQGGWPASNTDPYATGPTDDNEWMGVTDPHIAVLVPDASMLDGIGSDPDNGGPWVMWRDTPYAHLMIPAARKK